MVNFFSRYRASAGATNAFADLMMPRLYSCAALA